MRLLYRDWRPTLLARTINRFWCWYAGLGLPPGFMVALEIKGRRSGRPHTTVVLTTDHAREQYLVSMLGNESAWVRNARANPDAVIRHGRKRHVRLVEVPALERAPVLKEYVRIASSGRKHFPVSPGALLSEFEAIAEHYPVFRIDPR
jgi:deazaflavin-dependent oxidoreductase (nitroreductase family)